jgi:hypothetical protein
MMYITPQHMIGFNSELQKEAGRFGSALQAIKGFASNKAANTGSYLGRTGLQLGQELRGQYGRQLMLGAGGGALGGAALADPDQGVGGRVRGALKGALVGGSLIGGGILATKGGRSAAKEGLGNFYQRQKYSLTGRGLGDTHAERLKNARKIKLIEAPGSGSAKRIALQEDALKKGYMHIPGVVKGLASRNAGDVLKSGWQRGGGFGKAFAGLGAYETGKGLIETPEAGGPGRLEKGLRGAGSTIGWMVAPGTLLGGQLVGVGGGALAGKVGKLGDKGVQAVQNRRRLGQVVPQGGY